MKGVSKSLTVDISRKGGVRPIFAVENDTGSRKLTIKITDDGSPYALEGGTVAIMNYKRADGVSGASLAENLGDRVEVTLTPLVLGAKGIAVCSISLFDEHKNKITSSEFCIDVSEQLYSGEELDDAPEYGLLEDVLSRLADIESNETARCSAEEEREAAEANREQERENFENSVNARLDEQDTKLAGRLGESGSVTLFASKWSSANVQAITITGLRDDDMVIFYPATADDREYCGYYGVFVSPESEGGAFTVTARAIPAGDISLRYYVIRGSLPEIEEAE